MIANNDYIYLIDALYQCTLLIINSCRLSPVDRTTVNRPVVSKITALTATVSLLVSQL